MLGRIQKKTTFDNFGLSCLPGKSAKQMAGSTKQEHWPKVNVANPKVNPCLLQKKKKKKLKYIYHCFCHGFDLGFATLTFCQCSGLVDPGIWLADLPGKQLGPKLSNVVFFCILPNIYLGKVRSFMTCSMGNPNSATPFYAGHRGVFGDWAYLLVAQSQTFQDFVVKSTQRPKASKWQRV